MKEDAEPNVDMVYRVREAKIKPGLNGDWDGPAWQQADTCAIEHFHAESSDHRPVTRARLLYDDTGIYVIFSVDKDRYVRCAHTGYQALAWVDSCVEFFIQPRPDKGYFNFEMNCGGNLLLHYNTKVPPSADRYAKHASVPWEVGKGIKIYHSMPEVVLPEREEETDWCVEYFVPFTVFEVYVGSLGPVAGQEWRGNFYKCADESSHPHWATWAPIGEELNFHQPRFFGTIRFEK